MAAEVGNSILIHVLKNSSSKDVKTVDDIGTDGYDVKRLFPCWRRCPTCCRSDSDSDSDSHHADSHSKWVENAWFLIEQAYPALKISQIFADLPQQQPKQPIGQSALSLIGSSVYAIGGVGCCGEFGQNKDCRHIQSFDIRNLSEGWRNCNHINFNFRGDRAAAMGGKYIYMFGRIREESVGYRFPKFHFAYVYDTIEQEGYYIHDGPDPELLDVETPAMPCAAEVWAPLEGRGMLVSCPSINGKFYLHDPDQNCWKSCENYQPLPTSISGPRTVSNGILYIFDTHKPPIYDLYAYDCNEGKLLYKATLPRLCKNTSKVDANYYGFQPEYLVALSDSIICLLWHSGSYIFCASVSVSSGDPPSIEHLGVRCFRNDDIRQVVNCVPVDASLGRIAKTSSVPLENTREEQKQLEGQLRTELSGNCQNVTSLPDDFTFLGQKTAKLKCTQKTMNPFSTLPMSPFSKRMLYQPLMKKTKREHRVTLQRLSRRKLSPKPRNPPSTHQSSDDLVKIVAIPENMKLERHQEVKSLGNDLSEGQA